MPKVVERVEAVRRFRAKSRRALTVKRAATPTRFMTENVPTSRYLAVPKVSSERRAYVPIGFMNASTLVSDLMFITRTATEYEFGILSSLMHNAWMRTVAGRLKSDYRYSAGILYNNFIWPADRITIADVDMIEDGRRLR